jgi:hypothetical protein
MTVWYKYLSAHIILLCRQMEVCIMVYHPKPGLPVQTKRYQWILGNNLSGVWNTFVLLVNSAISSDVCVFPIFTFNQVCTKPASSGLLWSLLQNLQHNEVEVWVRWNSSTTIIFGIFCLFGARFWLKFYEAVWFLKAWGTNLTQWVRRI